jgi:hypothetical protein
MDYRNELLNKINNLIEGRWDVPTFEKEYYNFYLEKVPKDSLTNIEHEFFGLVQEKLDWTSRLPTREESGYGWGDYNTYIQWLKNNTEKFLKDEANWSKNSVKNLSWNYKD